MADKHLPAAPQPQREILFVYELAQPFDYGDDRYTKLEIRKPDGNDVIALKYMPYEYAGEGIPTLRYDLLYSWVAKLTDNPLSFAKRIAIPDMTQIGYRLTSFLTLGSDLPTSTNL